jgi:hypothetical protein
MLAPWFSLEYTEGPLVSSVNAVTGLHLLSFVFYPLLYLLSRKSSAGLVYTLLTVLLAVSWFYFIEYWSVSYAFLLMFLPGILLVIFHLHSGSKTGFSFLLALLVALGNIKQDHNFANFLFFLSDPDFIFFSQYLNGYVSVVPVVTLFYLGLFKFVSKNHNTFL